MNHLEHRVQKQERSLAVVEPPRHFVKALPVGTRGEEPRDEAQGTSLDSIESLG
jgi:hypothetical protein